MHNWWLLYASSVYANLFQCKKCNVIGLEDGWNLKTWDKVIIIQNRDLIGLTCEEIIIKNIIE